jgi:hypothetical protein
VSIRNPKPGTCALMRITVDGGAQIALPPYPAPYTLTLFTLTHQRAEGCHARERESERERERERASERERERETERESAQRTSTDLQHRTWVAAPRFARSPTASNPWPPTPKPPVSSRICRIPSALRRTFNTLVLKETYRLGTYNLKPRPPNLQRAVGSSRRTVSEPKT